MIKRQMIMWRDDVRGHECVGQPSFLVFRQPGAYSHRTVGLHIFSTDSSILARKIDYIRVLRVWNRDASVPP